MKTMISAAALLPTRVELVFANSPCNMVCKRVSMPRAVQQFAFCYAIGCASLIAIAGARGQVIMAQQDIVAMYLFNGQDEATFKRQLEAGTSLRVARIAKIVGLKEEQQSKLEWAIHGDLNRFYHDIELVREKTKGLSVNQQDELQRAWEHISPLYEKVRGSGVIGQDSLFEKVLAATLDRDQSRRYHDYLNDRQRAESWAMLRMSLAELEKAIPLMADQRAKLVALLEKENPRREPGFGQPGINGFREIANLQDEDVQSILDDEQYAAFKKFQQTYQGFRFGGIAW